jgi:hypothetical protein
MVTLDSQLPAVQDKAEGSSGSAAERNDHNARCSYRI